MSTGPDGTYRRNTRFRLRHVSDYVGREEPTYGVWYTFAGVSLHCSLGVPLDTTLEYRTLSQSFTRDSSQSVINKPRNVFPGYVGDGNVTFLSSFVYALPLRTCYQPAEGQVRQTSQST